MTASLNRALKIIKKSGRLDDIAGDKRSNRPVPEVGQFRQIPSRNDVLATSIVVKYREAKPRLLKQRVLYNETVTVNCCV